MTPIAIFARYRIGLLRVAEQHRGSLGPLYEALCNRIRKATTARELDDVRKRLVEYTWNERGQK
jgi:hypothetical protein